MHQYSQVTSIQTSSSSSASYLLDSSIPSIQLNQISESTKWVKLYPNQSSQRSVTITVTVTAATNSDPTRSFTLTFWSSYYPTLFLVIHSYDHPIYSNPLINRHPYSSPFLFLSSLPSAPPLLSLSTPPQVKMSLWSTESLKCKVGESVSN